MNTPASWYKPTSITIHPDTAQEIASLKGVFGTSQQDVMRKAIARAGRPEIALTVPERCLHWRDLEATRRPKMLYLRSTEQETLWRIQRSLDLNVSRAIEVCVHNAWLAYAPK